MRLAKDGLEIERKWLLRRAPTAAQLLRLGATAVEIDQIYLTEDPPGLIRRLRRIERAEDDVTYVLTEKRRVSDLVRTEREWELNSVRYIELMGQADPEREVIRKARWTFNHAGTVFELDVFHHPRGLVLLEAELADADQTVELPAALDVEREVTDEPAFNNYELSRRR